MKEKLVFFLLVSCLVGCALSAGDANHDRPFNDLPNMPIKLPSNQNEADCSLLCANDTVCVAWAYIPPNCGGSPAYPQCFLKSSIPAVVPASCRISGLKDLTLLPKKYQHFPVGSILPQGWLRNQLQTEADGLAGHLALFWGSINQSAWIGVKGGDEFERVPYWLNGIIPLAYMLKDAELLEQVNNYVSYILDHQASDGWLGPTCCDPWPRFPLLLALIQYHEANPADNRVIPAMWKFFFRLRQELDMNPLSVWAYFRWQDLVLAIHWMFENYPQGQQQFLLDFAEVAHNQGFDWGAFFASNEFPEGPCVQECPASSLKAHGVNVGQALKSGSVWFRQSKDSGDYESTYQRFDRLYQFHGLASGIFGCDEFLAGNMPSHGSELCTVVETMFSFEVIQELTGDPTWGDRIELLGFNALPATITPDMWAHQYLQQSNEINAAHIDPNIWTTDGPDSNLYGLEPNFGCCTANFDQGWSKFATHLFAKTLDNGIAAMLYAPSTLTTQINGRNVSVDLVTDYPWSDTLTFTIKSGVAFPFYLRIPGWANNATVTVNTGRPIMATASSYHLVQASAGITYVVLTLPMSFRVQRRYNNAASIYYGPILFAVDIPPVWTVLRHFAFNSSDWQALPAGQWAYAINLNDQNPQNSLKLVKRPVGSASPFSGAGSPYIVTANGKPIQWGTTNNAADPPPVSPVMSSKPTQTLTLLPFGATKLRIAEIPVLAN